MVTIKLLYLPWLNLIHFSILLKKLRLLPKVPLIGKLSIISELLLIPLLTKLQRTTKELTTEPTGVILELIE